MPTIGVLTVDLVANTAEFQGSLSKADQAAQNFGKSAGDAGNAMDSSMGSSTGAVRLLTHELGVPLPRELSRLIATLPAVGAAFEAALPIIGVVAAIAVIEKLVVKAQEAKEKMAEATASALHGDAAVFEGLDEKLLSVQKKVDELAGNHLGALQKELKLIDMATLKDLEQTFDHFATNAEKHIKDITGAWYELQLGTSGQAAALTAFKDQYNDLLDQKKTKEAGDLLVGTLQVAKDKLAEMNAVKGTAENYASQTDIDRQQVLVQALENQVRAQKEIAQIANTSKSNYQTVYDKSVGEAQLKFYEMLAKAKANAAKIAEESADEETKAVNEQLSTEMRERLKANSDAVDAYKSANEEMLKSDAERTRQSIVLSTLAAEGIAEQARHELVMHRNSAQAIIAQEIADQNALYAVKAAGYQHAIDIAEAYYGKGSSEAIKAHAQQEEAERKHQNEIDKIVNKGEEEKERLIKQAEDKIAADIAHSVTQSLFQHKSLAAGMRQMGEQMVEGMTENLLKMVLLNDYAKLSNAAKAASDAMAQVPFPLNLVVAPAVFAATMAFAQGGLVPGIGSGDTVPAMLTPGETVVTKALTEQVANSTTNHGGDVHVHTSINAVDAAGFEKLLDKHAAVVGRHVQSQMRRAHKRF
jgi:hypothetical protein